MAFDITTPANSDNFSTVPGVVRTLKTDFATAIGNEHSFVTANLELQHKIPYSASAPISGVIKGRTYYDTSLNTLRMYNTSWKDIMIKPFPTSPVRSLTKFAQAAAPTGWTKLTSVDQKYLKIAKSTDTVGATYAGDAFVSSSNSHGIYQHAISTVNASLSHSVSYGLVTNSGFFPAIASINPHTGSHSHTVAEDYSHSHSVTLTNIKYVHVIMCTKDD